MKTTTTEDRIEIARYLFRKPGNFKAYFTIYDNIARRENDFVLQVEHFNRETLLSHQHVMVVATFLKKHTMMAPYDLRSAIKAGHGLVTVSDANIKHAINLAVHGMLMVDTKAREYHNPAYTLGGQPPTFWSENETFLQFAKETFPITNDVSNKAKNAMDEHALMRAWKLQKRLGLKFKVTDSLAEYLLFDRNYIYIFHHTSFLKAQLEAFTGDNSPLDLDLEHTLPRGKLPPQLLVETLHSLQTVLFPSVDERSRRILQDLIKKGRFDEDCARYEGYKLFHDTPEHFRYLYWGERMAALHDKLTATPQNRPRNRLERWLERHSSERNALIVALFALLITLITGIISVILGAVQVWITYQAWKYPTH